MSAALRLPALLLAYALLAGCSATGDTLRAPDLSRLTPPAGHGPLLVVGGGRIPGEVRRAFIELSGGAAGRIAVFPHASARPEAGSSAREAWLEAGAPDVVVVPRVDEGATPEAVHAAIEGATALWFGGGSQNRLVEALAELDALESIRRFHAGGGAVGGSSAGAAVMSALMITGEAELERIAPGTTELSAGLGLWPGVIVDQHFLRRRRFHRLYAAIIDHPGMVGVGIDEGTAVQVEPGRWTILGASDVLVIDLRDATITAVDGAPRTAGARVDLLPAGTTVGDAPTRRSVAPPPPAPGR